MLISIWYEQWKLFVEQVGAITNWSGSYFVILSMLCDPISAVFFSNVLLLSFLSLSS